MSELSPEAIRARMQAQAANDATPISDEQARTVTALFGQYRLTPYQSIRLDATESHRRTTNTERRAILGYLAGAIHAHDLTTGWYIALFTWLISSPRHAETTAELRTILEAATSEMAAEMETV